MGIEIWNGSSWVSSNDPEINDGSSFVNIQKGELYNGSGWTTFYNRVTVTPSDPSIFLSSSTVSSITVYVTLPTGSPYKTQVEVYRTSNPLGRTLIPSSPAVGAISSSSGTHVETGLSASTSYQFSAKAYYYDATTNELVADSGTPVTANFSTSGYTLTVPTTPTNSIRAEGALTFSSVSSANFSTNGSTAYIRFHLEQYSTSFGWLEIADQDSLSFTTNSVTRDTQFTGLPSGETFRCRARTYYSTINQFSNYSGYSANVTTPTSTPTSTSLVALNNTTFLNTAASSASASSTASGSSPARASDGSTTTVWSSDPFTGSYVTETRNVTSIIRTSSIITYNFDSKKSRNYSEIDTGGISTLSSSAIYRWRYNDSGTGARYCYIRYGSGDDPPWAVGDTINIQNCADSSVNGNKQVISVKTVSDGTIAYTVPRTSTTTDSTWVSDGMNVSGSSAAGSPLSALNTTAYRTATTAGDLNARISSSSAGFTPTFTLMNSSTGTISLRGQEEKGAGSETLTLNFSPKPTLANPRLRGGVDYIQLVNDTLMAQSYSLEIANPDGTYANLGSYTLASGATGQYTFTATRYPMNLFGLDYFTFRLTCQRASTGVGYVVSWKEIRITFTYDQVA